METQAAVLLEATESLGKSLRVKGQVGKERNAALHLFLYYLARHYLLLKSYKPRKVRDNNHCL